MRHQTLSLYYAEPISNEIFEHKFGFEKNREAVLDHLTNQLANIAEKIRTTDCAPTIASQALNELHNVERNSFKELLEESTSSDLISHEPVLCESTTIAIQNKVPPSKEALDEVFRPSDDGVTSAAEQETVDNKRKKKAKTELLYSLSKSGKLWLQRSKQKRREYLASRGIWIEEEKEKEKEEEEEEDAGKRKRNKQRAGTDDSP